MSPILNLLPYSPKTIRNIGALWRTCREISVGAKDSRLIVALQLERPMRCGHTVARATLLRAVADGFLAPCPSVADLATYTAGVTLAYAVGAHLASKAIEIPLPQMIAALAAYTNENQELHPDE